MSSITWDNWQGDVVEGDQFGFIAWDNWRASTIVAQDETTRYIGEGFLRVEVDPEAPLMRGDALLVVLDTQEGPAPSGRVQRVKLAARVRWRTP